MKNIIKYLVVIILVLIPSSVFACGRCTDGMVLFIFPSIVFAFPLFIIWLITTTFFTFGFKKPEDNIAEVPHQHTKIRALYWVLLGVGFALSACLLGLPLLIIGFIILAILALTSKSSADISDVVYQQKRVIKLFWLILLIGLALASLSIVTMMFLPALLPIWFICGIWLIFLMKQIKNWLKIKTPSNYHKLLLRLHMITLIILVIVGIGTFVYSRTYQGKLIYLWTGLENARPALTSEELAKLLEHKNAKIRANALKELYFWHSIDIEKNKIYAPNIAKLLNDSDVWIRYEAIEALTKFKSKEYIKEIAGLLNDKEKMVRGKAATALGELQAKEILPSLKEQLANENDEEIRAAIMQAIQNIENKSEDSGHRGFKDSTLKNLGRDERELSVLDELLKIDSKDKEAWLGKGFAFERLGRDEDALSAYDEALKIDSKYKDAWYNKGFVLNYLGRNEEALLAYEEVQRLDPTDKEIAERIKEIKSKLGK